MRRVLWAAAFVLGGLDPVGATSCADQTIKRVIDCMAGDLDRAARCRSQAESTPCQPDEIGSNEPSDKARPVACGPGEYRWIPGYGQAARCAPYANGSGQVQRSRESGISGR